MKPIFYVYTKPGCHLCEILIEKLMETLRDIADIKFIDIESSPELFNEYREIIPLVKYRDKELFRYHYDHNVIKKIMMTFPSPSILT